MSIVEIKRKPERVMLRVVQGALEPADQHSRAMLRDRGYKVGDVVAGELKKPRSPGFHRLAHQLGSVIVENIEAFSNLSAHTALKRVQIEAGIGCDELGIMFPGLGPCTYRVPRSLSYESMDEGEFREVIESMCKYISKTYWPSMTPEKIERMAEMWVGA